MNFRNSGVKYTNNPYKKISMKIGTITFSNSQENYGQILQCFALVDYLRSLGHDAFLIRAKHVDIDDRTLLSKFVGRIKSLLHPKQFLKNYLENREIARQHSAMELDVKMHPRNFDGFIKNNIPTTDTWYDDITIYKTPPQADAFVCGSDQIWGGSDSFMYLQFAPHRSIKISYAASFGGFVPSQIAQKKIANYLSDFKWISLRENTGTELCKSMGFKDAETVPDPTLLLSVDRYKSLYDEKVSTGSSPYIFLYLLGNEIPLKVDEIFDFAKNNNLRVIYVTAHGRQDSHVKEYPEIPQWLQLIEHSDYVITNSYHGTIFSILYHKKFLSIPLAGIRARMNTRLDELLSRYNLKDRLYSNSLEQLFNEIDYTSFEKVNQEERTHIGDKFTRLLVD